ncbi:Membrane-associated transporter protein, partial [Orchesella cincta]
MSRVVEYVGVLHLLKDHVKETWTQFWANFSSSSDVNGGEDEKESNFRGRIKEKLERLKRQSIRIIDNSSNGQEDYSHLTRSKSRKELMQISAAVMGIEFSYAAETAFVSPLLLSIGLRHRHMTLIWCLSPLLGFFLTPLLGSLSDGCRSQLGRRRPFIILLSIGIILGLIMVPNGKTIGRMLGDTYIDDEPPDLKVPSELASHLLVVPPQLNSEVVTSSTSTSPPSIDSFEQLMQNLQQSLNSSDKRPGNLSLWDEDSSKEVKLSYKQSSSKHAPTEYEHGFRAWNSLTYKDKDLDQQEFLKTLSRKDKSQKINHGDLERFILQATQGAGSDEDEEDLPENSPTTEAEEKIFSNNQENNFPSQMNQSFEVAHGRNETRKSGSERMLRSKRLETSEKESVSTSSNFDSGNEDAVKSHPWGLVFTVIGTVLLDFDADACQKDHAKGLSTFTIMAGLGGSIGYFLGALNWENTFLGRLFGGHVRAVFTLVLFIFIACVIVTIRSFREIPIDRLWANKAGDGSGMPNSGQSEHKPKPCSTDNPLMRCFFQPNLQHTKKTYSRLEDDLELESSSVQSDGESTATKKSYGTIQETSFNIAADGEASTSDKSGMVEQVPTFREYLKTIVQLPKSLQWLCATNFFCWMSLVCYSLYFTDFVGEAVFGGDPTAPRGSPLKEKYDEGVRFGCWGMSLYSLSCSIYSLCIETLVNRFGARQVYIYGQLVYSVGMVFMAIARHPAGVIIFSWTAGIMYATLFTMPYLLVARYHAAETFDVDVDDLMDKPTQMRGLGTDVAIVSSMVFLAQITQALTLGTIVTAVGSTTAIVFAAAVFASCGALCARKVLYLDL